MTRRRLNLNADVVTREIDPPVYLLAAYVIVVHPIACRQIREIRKRDLNVPPNWQHVIVHRQR